MKKSTKIIIVIAVLVSIIALLFLFKDTILEQIDFNIRKTAMIESYNARKVIKTKDEDGYLSNKDTKLKIDNLKVENDTLTFDLLIKHKFFNGIKDKNLKLASGICIKDGNNKLVVHRSNPLLITTANQNKSYVFIKDVSKKRSINPYTYTFMKENNLKELPENVDLTVDKSINFNNLSVEDDMLKTSFSFKLKEPVSVDNLQISLNELTFLDGDKVFLYDYETFTEWVF